MKIVCWQTILMKYHTLFFRKLRKIMQILSSAAVVIGALRVKQVFSKYFYNIISLSQNTGTFSLVFKRNIAQHL